MRLQRQVWTKYELQAQQGNTVPDGYAPIDRALDDLAWKIMKRKKRNEKRRKERKPKDGTRTSVRNVRIDNEGWKSRRSFHTPT